MIENCPLCQVEQFPFLITFCRNHPELILIVSTCHKPAFSVAERKLIQKMFPGRKIRWEHGLILDHAHCHVFSHPDFDLKKEKKDVV